MSIITEPKAIRRLTVFIALIIGVAMIIPSNLAFASPDDGSDDSQSVNQEDGQEQEEQDDQTEPEETDEQLNEEPIEELPPIDEVPIDPCVEDPDACALEPEPPADPCLDNPDLPECQAPADPCLDNPDLPECQAPVICPDGGDPLSDGSCPPVPCTVGKPGCPPPCGPGTHLEHGQCVPNKRGGSSSSSSSSSTATVNLIGAEVSSCRLDGNAHGIQQRFNPVRYQACGLYPNAQLAYTDGFIMGCTQVGNTQQPCQAFVTMNTQPTQAAATQPNMQSTTQLTQTQPLTQSTQAIQPSAVS
jgi:hypothetical protein